MGIEGGKPKISIRVANTQSLDLAGQKALKDLRKQISGAGYEVDVPITKTAGPTQETLENVAIFVMGGASTALISAATQDIYNTSKKWAVGIFRKDKKKARDKDDQRPYVVILGPDGKPAKQITYEELSRELEQHRPRNPEK